MFFVGAFITNVKTIDVTCIFEVQEGGLYGCKVEHLIYGNQTEEIVIVGDHESGKTNDDVLAIYLFSANFEVLVFPSKLFQIFPNIEEFFLQDNRVGAIKVGDLVGAKLRRLEMSGNRVTLIENGAFQDAPNIEIVDLAGKFLLYCKCIDFIIFNF